MGAWFWISHHFFSALKDMKGLGAWPEFVGRNSSASPATGYYALHKAEAEDILKKALS